MKEVDMPPDNPAQSKVDRTVFVVSASFDDSDERQYWQSRTPQERVQHIEILRRINYGYLATERLQRVLRIVELGEC